MPGISFILKLLLIFSLLPWGAPYGQAALVSICAVQGNGAASPYQNQTIRTQGIVFADLDETARRGFFIQAPGCDNDPSTSDGLFVYLGERINVVQPGDLVEVLGLAQEYYGMTEISTAAAQVRLFSQGNALPETVELNPPSDDEGASAYFESLESMHLRLGEGLVVGPTDDDDRTWLARADRLPEAGHIFANDPRGTGQVLCIDDGGAYEISPEARSGDRLLGLRGALDFAGGEYCLELTAAPLLLPVNSSNPPDPIDPQAAFSAAVFNLENLFDTIDDPETDDSVLSPFEYQRRLGKRALAIHAALGEPTFLAVQEVENQAVLQDLILQPVIQARYNIAWQETPDERGMDVALLYRSDQAVLLEMQARQGCTKLLDGLGPDGNRDMQNPHNEITCDTDGDEVLDGNRLFSRPPLAAHVRLHVEGQDLHLWLITNHWKSKLEDDALLQYTLARRSAQARFTAVLAQEIAASYPGEAILVLGDLNDGDGTLPLAILEAQGFQNLLSPAGKEQQYTYINRGRAQALDHILATLPPGLALGPVSAVHVNADLPAALEKEADTYWRSSDHDPLAVNFAYLKWRSYLPVVYGKAPAGPVLISEMLYDPGSKDETLEWIEVYNAGSQPFDLTGWHLGDEETPGSAEGLYQFPSGAILAPGDWLVIASQGSAFYQRYGFLPDFEWIDSHPETPDLLRCKAWSSGGLGLNDDGDEVLLLDRFYRLVDAVSWGISTWAFAPAALDVPSGQSLTRITSSLDTDSAADWKARRSPTPGSGP